MASTQQVAQAITDLTAFRVSNSVNDPAVKSEIVACGVIPWRMSQGQLQVLVIHRPEYDDWSWPKGKLDEGETLPECAIRETREEIGLNITLGIPLPATHYTVTDRKNPELQRTKEVWYWAAEVTRQKPVADQNEVDEVAWVSTTEAASRLTNPGDIAPLEALIAAWEQDTLKTRPLIFLRHAKAKPRSSWSRAESERPLAATGKRQAWAVKNLLTAWNPTRVVSSPWVRCMQTVTPYAKTTKLKIRTAASLTEKRAAQKPRRTASEVASQLGKDHPTVVCTHRPVLPVVLEVLGEYIERNTPTPALRHVLREALPVKNPHLKPGSALVLHQALSGNRGIVAVEIYGSYDL